MPCVNPKTGVSVHATLKVHSVPHVAEMKAAAGASGNFSCSVCELVHKPIAKHKQHLTNNKRAFLGLSLIKTNLRATVSRMLCQRMAASAKREIWKCAGSGEEFRVDRHYQPTKPVKGCVGMCIHANFMERAQDMAARWHVLGGGGRGGRNTLPKLGLRIADFVKHTPGHVQAGTVPWFQRKHPQMHAVPKKLANFLNDYMHDEFPSLQLGLSNGQHKELGKDDILALLGRLQRMQTRDKNHSAEIAVFGLLKLGSKGRKGCQHICCYPFSRYHSYNRQVWSCILMF